MAISGSRPPGQGERKLVTTLFADLSGFTALSETLAARLADAWEAGDSTVAGDLLRTAVARAEESGWGWL